MRVIQEALANVRKHAQAHHVWISFTQPEKRVLRMIIRDDGQGFDRQAVVATGGKLSFGLASMRERAESLDGALAVESQPGEGTRIELTIPLTSKALNGLLAPAAR